MRLSDLLSAYEGDIEQFALLMSLMTDEEIEEYLDRHLLAAQDKQQREPHHIEERTSDDGVEVQHDPSAIRPDAPPHD